MEMIDCLDDFSRTNLMRVKIKKIFGSREWRDKVDEMDDKELKDTYRLLFNDGSIVSGPTKSGPGSIRYEQMRFNLEAIG